MATIQIRDIPDDVYETYRRRAAAAGQSLQVFMRTRLVEIARTEARKAEMFAEMRSVMETDGGTGVAVEDILADLDADRGR